MLVRAVMFVAVVASGCGGSDPLSYEAVTMIAAGNAVGDGASGRYQFDRVIERCSSGCSFTSASRTYVLCDEGKTNSDPFEVVEQDGRLELDVARRVQEGGWVDGWDFEDELPLEMIGGIYSDGHFEVGGAIPAVRGMQSAPLGRVKLSGMWQGNSFFGKAEIKREMVAGGVTSASCEAEESIVGSRVMD